MHVSSSSYMLSQIEYIHALRRNPKIAKRLGLPNEICQEDESRRSFLTAFGARGTDNNKTVSWRQFAAFYCPESALMMMGDPMGHPSALSPFADDDNGKPDGRWDHHPPSQIACPGLRLAPRSALPLDCRPGCSG